MIEDKKQSFKAQDILNVIFSFSIIFSQAFYLNILLQQGISAFAAHLAPAVPGPHIHEILQNPSLYSNSNQPVYFLDPSFDIIRKASAWPITGFGILTGIGVVITTLTFNFFSWIVLNITFLFLYLALFLSPLLLLVALVIWLLEDRPFLKIKKSSIFVIVSSIFLAAAMLLIALNLHSPSGWRAALFFRASFLMKDAGFYMNPLIYSILAIAYDYWLIKKMIKLFKSH